MKVLRYYKKLQKEIVKPRNFKKRKSVDIQAPSTLDRIYFLSLKNIGRIFHVQNYFYFLY